MDKHLNVGVYEATDAFRAIKLHSCVCFDDLGLVASVGPAGDKESEKYAELFAAAPEMLDLLKQAASLLQRSKRIIEQSSSVPHVIETDIETLYWKIDELMEIRNLSDYKFIASEASS